MNKLYLKGKECLGKDMSATQDSLGCVEALAAVFKLAIGQELGENLSTIRLYNGLLKDRRFQRVISPQLGDIILSPTSGKEIGHTGIVSDNGKIMSNRSLDSLWSEHLTLADWWYKYKNLPIVFFRYQFPVEPAILPKEPIPELSNIEQQKINIWQQMIKIYQQIISQLSNKLGSNNMEKSKLFRVGLGDLGKGLLVAVLSTVFLAFGSALNAENFSFATFDYASLLQVAMASGMGYVVKQFITNSEGTILGRER